VARKPVYLALRGIAPILSAGLLVGIVIVFDPVTPVGLRGLRGGDTCPQFLPTYLALALGLAAFFLAVRFAVTGKGLFWWLVTVATTVSIALLTIVIVLRACTDGQ